MKEVRNLFLITLGWIFVLVGVVGIFMPVLPTVPFMILAAACFSRGSPRLHRWLRGRKRLGPAIRLWEDHRVIPPLAKRMSTLMIFSGIGFSIAVFEIPRFAEITMASLGLLAIVFIWRQKDRIPLEQQRPEPATLDESESSKASMRPQDR